MYNELLGQLHFWLFFVGVNVLFFPMHFLGLRGDAAARAGLCRRLRAIGTTSRARSATTIMAVGMGFFFVNVLWSLFAGKKAPDNPWGEGATTLEWTLSSPPPFHQFETLPRID